MKKLVFIIIFSYFIILASGASAARTGKKIYPEDTVTESMWDWLTTLGKSPEAKQKIKNEHRIKRAKKRAARNRKAKIKAQQKLNRAREKEAQWTAEARIRAKRKKLQDQKRKSAGK